MVSKYPVKLVEYSNPAGPFEVVRHKHRLEVEESK